MRTVAIQEIIDNNLNVLGFLYQEFCIPFLPNRDTSFQLSDGTMLLPIHMTYDVEDATLYLIDAVQVLYLGNCQFREFLNEHLDNGWKFREDVRPDSNSPRIRI